MNITQVREARTTLEGRIHQLCVDFEQATGCKIGTITPVRTPWKIGQDMLASRPLEGVRITTYIE